MKNRTQSLVKIISTGVCLSFVLIGGAARAAVYYWNPQWANPTNAASQQNPYLGSLSGTWESTNWNSSSTGVNTSDPTNWPEGDAVCFAVHTGAGTPAFILTMNSNHTVAGFFNGPLTPDPCQVTVVGPGILTLEPANLNGFAVSGDGTSDPGYLTLAVTLAGGATAGVCPEDNSGQTFLNGTNTYSGGTYLGYSGDAYSSSIINFNNPASFGTSNLYFLNCTGGALVVEGSSAITITNQFVMYQETAATCNIVGNPAGVTFSGNWALSGGTPGLGASPYATNNVVLPSYGPLNLGSGGAANDLIIISGVISGTNNFNKYGVGILALSAVNTFSGNITNSTGTLALTNGGSINNSPNLTVLAGSTFDVTGVDPYTLSSSTTLIVNGTGSIQGTNASTINDSASGGSVNLGSQPIKMTFTPASANGDTTHPPLYISNGKLSLGGNAFTVINNVPGVPLGAGTYVLINATAGGPVTDGGGETVTVTGAGLAAGATASISTDGNGNEDLVVSGGEPVPLFSNLTANQSKTYGTAAITLAGTVSGSGPVYPAQGETISVTIDGQTQTTTIDDSTGDFSFSYNPATIPVTGSPWTITYVYGGDASLNSVTNTSTTLTVTAAPVTVTAIAKSVVYGTAAPYAASTQFSAVLSNSQTIGTVTLTGSGTGYIGTNTPAAVGAYTLTPSAATGGTFTAANYAFTYAAAANTLTVTPAALTITASAESYTYGSTYTGIGTLKTTNFTETGASNGQTTASMTVTLTASGVGGTPAAQVAGSYTITPSAVAELSGKTNFSPGNYTINYVASPLTVNQLAVKLTGSQPYNGSTYIEANSLTVSNAVNGDPVYVAQGLAFTAVAEPPGVWPIASYGTLVLGDAGGQGTGTGSTAATDQFNAPGSVAVDTSGNVYVADTANNRVCEITPAGVQTVVPFTGLSNPTGVAVDVFSNIYVADPSLNAVFEMPAGGSQTTVAFSGLNYPTALAVDKSGDLFVSDTLNNRVLELPVGGSQTTVAGLTVLLPAGLAVDTNGDIFVVSAGANSVVELPSGGSQKPLTGLTNYSFPVGLAVDNYTNVYLASYGSGNVRVLSLGASSPVLFTNAFVNLSEPEGVAVDASGDVFAADTAHNRLEELPINGSPGSLTYGPVTYFGALVSNNYVVNGASGDVTNTATPTFSGLTASPSITYGTTNLVLAGTVSAPGPTYPASGTIITVTINTNSQTGAISGSSGAFSIAYKTTNLPASATPYTITYTSAASGALLASTNTATSLTVNPLPVILIGTQTYNGTTNVLAASLSVSNTVGSDNVTVAPGGVGGMASAYVGTNAITSIGTLALTGAQGTDYTLTGASGAVIVTPASLTITANSLTSTEGLTNPPLTASYVGFVGSDTSASLTTQPTLSTTATTNNAPGQYPITVTNAADTNYTITYVPGILTIVAPPQISGVSASNGSLVFSFPSVAGELYQLMETSDLTLPFTPVGSPVTGTGGSISLTNAISATGQEFFTLSISQ